jgi:hypothetical protein
MVVEAMLQGEEKNTKRSEVDTGEEEKRYEYE